MATIPSIFDALVGLTPYPVQPSTLQVILLHRGLDGTAAVTADTLNSVAYRLAVADVYAHLADAPSVSQGGQSYSFSEAQAEDYRNRANAIYAALSPSDAESGIRYGYKGDRL